MLSSMILTAAAFVSMALAAPGTAGSDTNALAQRSNAWDCTIPSATCSSGSNDAPIKLCDLYCKRIGKSSGVCVRDNDCWDWAPGAWRCNCRASGKRDEQEQDANPTITEEEFVKEMVAGADAADAIAKREEGDALKQGVQKRFVCSIGGWIGGGLCELECQKQGCIKGGHCSGDNICTCNC